MDLENRREMTAPGPFEARYLAFLGTIANLRPSLHRYCSRMTGSVLDGEDVVQEALFQAYRMLDSFDDSRGARCQALRRDPPEEVARLGTVVRGHPILSQAVGSTLHPVR